MKKLTLIVLAAVAIVGAAAFASSRIWAASPAASPRAAQPCGEQVFFGHVKSVTPRGGRFELRFDPAWFTSGQTATLASLEDTGYGDVPNDNYLIEEGHRLLTYILPATARIIVLTKNGRPDTGGFPSTAITPSQLAELLAGKQPVKLFEVLSTGFWMHVHVDTVCSLRQQYHP